MESMSEAGITTLVTELCLLDSQMNLKHGSRVASQALNIQMYLLLYARVSVYIICIDWNRWSHFATMFQRDQQYFCN